MTNRTITARDATLNGLVAGVTYTNGSATADDATPKGKKAIAFAKRQGWGVSGGLATAVDLTAAQGEAISRWTLAECQAYLDAMRVAYPSATDVAGLRLAIRDAFETKAQGGSAANESAGHTSGTIPPEGAPPVSNPDKPDDEDITVLWHTPLTANSSSDVAPAITVQPVNASAYVGETETLSVTATGTAPLTYRWEKQEAGAGDWILIEGADEATYTTAVLTLAENADTFHVVVGSTDGFVTSDTVTLTVTAGTAPTISVQPTNQSVTAPAAATFAVTAALGTPTATRQWQRQAAGAGAWVDIDGATGASYQTPATTVSGGAANNTDKYRVVITNVAGSVTSTAVTLTVA